LREGPALFLDELAAGLSNDRRRLGFIIYRAGNVFGPALSDFSFAVSLKEATVVYLFTYHPDEEKIDFHELASGARVITVSEPLIQKGFIIHKSMRAVFPWGETEVFINKKI
jgi:hypothetical protein